MCFAGVTGSRLTAVVLSFDDAAGPCKPPLPSRCSASAFSLVTLAMGADPGGTGGPVIPTIFRPRRSTMYVDAAYCYGANSVVCLSVGRSICL